MKLLVTERDPLVRQIMATQAAELGVQVVFATDRGETISAISDERPDCVVMDASSCSDDAPAPLWAELKQNPATVNLPLLLYSSSERWQSVAALAASQVDAYLPRPFSTATLLHAARAVRVKPARA